MSELDNLINGLSVDKRTEACEMLTFTLGVKITKAFDSALDGLEKMVLILERLPHDKINIDAVKKAIEFQKATSAKFMECLKNG